VEKVVLNVWMRRALVALAALAACFVAFVVFVAVWEANVGRPESAARAGCNNQLHIIAGIVLTWAHDHGGTLPPVPDEAVTQQEAERGLLRCPGRKATYHGESLGPEVPYVYVGGGMLTLAIMNPARTPIVFDAAPLHPGPWEGLWYVIRPQHTRNVLMANGEVVNFEEADFRRLVGEALARENYGEDAARRLRELLSGK